MDKRYQKAEELIRREFFAMLEEMPVYKITVSELCRRTDINRGTFYLHYQDCYELIEVLSRELVELFSPHVEAICRDRDTLEDSVVAMLHILIENGNAARLIQSSDMCRQIINHHFRGVVMANWRRVSRLSDEEADVIYAYIAGGVFEAVNAIKPQGAAFDYDKHCRCICRLVVSGLSAFVS